MKKCKRCEKEKPLAEFYKHKAMGDGHLGFCIECVKERVRFHRERNLDAIRASDRFRNKRENMTPEQIKKINESAYERNFFGWNRAKAMRRDKYTCQKCGSKTKKLCVHHKKGGSRYSKKRDNSLTNLQTLCIPCHTEIHSKERIKNGYIPPRNPRGKNGCWCSPRSKF